MIVVDSGVWADWFRQTPTPETDRLDRAMDVPEPIGTVPIILTEVLQGFRSDPEFESARATLLQLPIFVLDPDGHVDAARLYRSLRRRGVTVRGAVDCVIAQTCIAVDAEILTGDRDFVALARFSALRLCST